VTIEARTMRKVQIRIIPFIFLLYVVAFLDRINIGFAALTLIRAQRSTEGGRHHFKATHAHDRFCRQTNCLHSESKHPSQLF